MSLHEPSRPSSLLGFRAMHSTWAEHMRAVREVTRVLRRPPQRVGGDVLLVLPSYGRPQNLDLAVRLGLRSPQVGLVLVVDDHPEVRVERWIDERHPRLSIVRTRGQVGPVARYIEGRRIGADRLVSIDDDLFLRPSALAQLVAHLDRAPEVPHGLYGQRWGGSRFEDNLARFDGEVDLLNRVYAFTGEHLAEYFALLEELALDLDDPAVSRALDDDIPLAFCGDARPRVHDVGAWLDCPTERARGLARWRRSDAGALRRDLYLRLRTRVRFDGDPQGTPSRPPRSPRSLPLGWLSRFTRHVD